MGLRVAAATPGEESRPMTAGPPMHRDPVRRPDDTGIRVLAVEVLRIGPGTKREYHERALESGAELGARYVIVNGDDPNIDRVSGAMRLLPGEGELPLAELLAVFPEGILVSVEAPSSRCWRPWPRSSSPDAPARRWRTCWPQRARVPRRVRRYRGKRDERWTCCQASRIFRA